MKQLNALFIACLLTTIGQAQNPGLAYEHSLGGKSNDMTAQMISTTDGGYAIVGSSYSNDGDILFDHHGEISTADIWVSRLTADRATIWSRSIGGTGDDFGYGIYPTSDDGFIVIGTSSSSDGDMPSNLGGTDAVMIKLRSDGAVEWVKTYGGTEDDALYAITNTGDQYVAVGYTASFNNPDLMADVAAGANKDAWIMITDQSGNMLNASINGGGNDDVFYAVNTSAEGRILAAGYSRSSNGDVSESFGNADAWIAMYANHAELLWQHAYGSSGDEMIRAIAMNADHEYLLAGNTDSNNGMINMNHGANDIWVVRISDEGVPMNNFTFGGSESDQANDIDLFEDGTFLITGYTKSNDGDIQMSMGGVDYCAIKSDMNGNILFSKNFGGSNEDIAAGALLLPEDHFMIYGTSYSADGNIGAHYYSPESADVWFAEIGYYQTWYADLDADGFGNPAISVSSVTQPCGYKLVAGDCDDANAFANPLATEICNGFDDNCDGIVDDAPLNVAIYGADLLACAGDVVTLSATPGMNSYQWFRNDLLIPGATGISLDVIKSGTYSVKVSGGFCVGTAVAPYINFNKKPQALVYYQSLNLCPAGSVKLKVKDPAGNTFQWMKDGAAIEGATTEIYVATTPGVYCVVEKNLSGCSATSLLMNIVEACRMENTADDAVQIFPNPAQNNFTIHMTLNASADETASLMIFNLLGQLMVQQTIIPSSAQTDVNIQATEQWSNGMYTVVVQYGDQVYQQQLLIQQ